MRTLFIFLVFGVLLPTSRAEPPAPQSYSTVSVGRPYQDNTPDGIDINQLLASAGERGAQFDTFAAQGYASPPQTGYAAPPSYGPPPTPAPGGYGLPGYPEDKEFFIKKQISIHVPPPEAEFYPTPTKPPQSLKREKHYKIIFIKAPAPPPIMPPEFYIPPPPEQKTLVYVLVRKPDPPKPFSFPELAPTPASKPEVYFIRYKPPASGGYESAPIMPQYAPAVQQYSAPLPTSAPMQQYGAPPVPVYSAPASTPVQQYGAPTVPVYSAPTSTYGAPAPIPASYTKDSYAQPPQVQYRPQPSPVYYAPLSKPNPTYEVMSKPSNSYGPPPQLQNTYLPPTQPVQNTYSLPSQTYGAPMQNTYIPPSQTYGTPVQNTYSPPSPTYGAPIQNTYGLPQTPSVVYGNPLYSAPPQTQSYSIPKPPSMTYGLPHQSGSSPKNYF